MKVEEEKWETCEIEFVNQSGFLDEIQYKTMGYFNAKAIGQRGIYSAGKTAKIKLERYNKQTDQALKALVAQLVQEGWEPVPASGEDWYTHIFRRRAN